MKIEFANKRLALIRTDRAYELDLPVGVTKACRDKLNFIAASPDERTLRDWKSLNYKKREAGRSNELQIRINDQYRITLTLDDSTTPPTVTIVDIGDPH
jgi:toxin HigB-1